MFIYSNRARALAAGVCLIAGSVSMAGEPSIKTSIRPSSNESIAEYSLQAAPPRAQVFQLERGGVAGGGRDACTDAGVDPECCDIVCAVDPFCCDVAWDDICLQEQQDLCGKGGNCTQELCIPNGTPNGACFCDEACCSFGDCCDNKFEACAGCPNIERCAGASFAVQENTHDNFIGLLGSVAQEIVVCETNNVIDIPVHLRTGPGRNLVTLTIATDPLGVNSIASVTRELPPDGHAFYTFDINDIVFLPDVPYYVLLSGDPSAGNIWCAMEGMDADPYSGGQAFKNGTPMKNGDFLFATDAGPGDESVAPDAGKAYEADWVATGPIEPNRTVHFDAIGNGHMHLSKELVEANVNLLQAEVELQIGENVNGFSQFSVVAGQGDFDAYLWRVVPIGSANFSVIEGKGSIEWATGDMIAQFTMHVFLPPNLPGMHDVIAVAYSSATIDFATGIITLVADGGAHEICTDLTCPEVGGDLCVPGICGVPNGSPNGLCFCDQACCGLGDCCDNADELCGAVNCGDLCPDATIVSSIPETATTDARQPFPPTGGPLQGVQTVVITLSGRGSANLNCWSYCENPDGSNAIASVTNTGGNTFAVALATPLAQNTANRINYDGGIGGPLLIAHPANTNADGVSSASDVLFVIDMLNGVTSPPFGLFSQDIDHSNAFTPADILRTVDLLNGAAAYDSQNLKVKPTAGPCQ